MPVCLQSKKYLPLQSQNRMLLRSLQFMRRERSILKLRLFSA